MRDADGRLLRTWKDGEAKLNAYLEDHAYLLEALLALYEATFEQRWFDAARETADAMIERFADAERGGFFTTSDDHEELIARRKDIDDHPIPSGNSSAAYGLLRLAALTGEHAYEQPRRLGASASSHRVAGTPPAGRRPPAARDRLPPRAGPGGGAGRAARRRRARRLAAVVRSELRPHLVLAGGAEGADRPELMRERRAVDGRAAAYVCERFACRAPVTEPRRASAALLPTRRPGRRAPHEVRRVDPQAASIVALTALGAWRSPARPPRLPGNEQRSTAMTSSEGAGLDAARLKQRVP